MSAYRIAQVRFSVDGRPYPVNAKFEVTPGEFVIVRLEGKFTPLHKAEVISVGVWRNKCKHSIACRASRAAAYGGGPDEITNEDELHRFLLEYVRLKKYPIVLEARHGEKAAAHPRWHAAYIKNYFYGELGDGFGRASQIIILGQDEIMYRSPDSGQHIEMVDGALLLRDTMTVPITPKDGNIYQRAAEHAERIFAEDVSPSFDTSLGEIRQAIGGDGYLSDGEYA